MAAKVALVDPVLGPLTDDLLTRDVRVFQRAKGHRFSSDDVATAYVAFNAMPRAERVLDLGCGLGSVLLHLAWKLPQARLTGVEAQAMSFELLQRNVARSGFAERLCIHHGDIRDQLLLAGLGGPFQLITGTPPYFPPETARDAEDEQRAFARIEYRGGVEAYIEAGARLLAPDGLLVLCGDARVGQRTTLSSQAAGLSIHSRCDVVPRAGRAALFSIWTLGWQPISTMISTFTLRDSVGEPTTDAGLLREFSGITRSFP
ncbi:MAG TPA: methyltransferase [Polyangiaceae bacterium]|nr:methyltransferase [Polyangiaceae bacterium]